MTVKAKQNNDRYKFVILWARSGLSTEVPPPVSYGLLYGSLLPLPVILFTCLQRGICADIQRIGQQQFVGR